MTVPGDGQAATVLSLVVPCYNSQDYVEHCLDSMLPVPPDVEVIVVNDGSTDRTEQIAQRYVDEFPGRFRLVNKPNGGHGSAINAGLGQARGSYFKVIDSDDWVDQGAYRALIDGLRTLVTGGQPDLVITNFVYEKLGKRRKHVMSFGNVFPDEQVVTWDRTGRFRRSQYLLMHSLTYRTELLREVGLELPEHTFYVDNLYAYVPMAAVRTLYYLDVDLYRYFIGRPDQSVSEDVMVKRADQQLKVNRLMIANLPSRDVDLPTELRRYLESYLGVVTAVSSIICLRAGTQKYLAEKSALWRELRRADRVTHRRLRRSLMGRLVNLRGPVGQRITLVAYKLARGVFGFN
ncbi:MAG: glycosyltransferase family 2 protein [Brooklawnia sp.]